MQKWEYLHVKTDSDRVMFINGQRIGKVKSGILSTSVEGEMIYEFLNKMGHEGWELVSDSAHIIGDKFQGHTLIFIRPIESDEN